LALIFHFYFFNGGQVLLTSELLGKTDVVSLKLHCSLVLKGEKKHIKVLYLTWKIIKDS
jgi:hypothetical protein